MTKKLYSITIKEDKSILYCSEIIPERETVTFGRQLPDEGRKGFNFIWITTWAENEKEAINFSKRIVDQAIKEESWSSLNA